MTKLTKSIVDKSTPQEKDQFLWDEDLKGFGLKITPKGRKVFVVQYRLGGRKGRTRRITVGEYGVLTPTEARQKAKHYLGDVAAYRDPAAEIDALRASQTMSELLEMFMSEHAEAKLKTATVTEYKRIKKLHVLPALKNRLVKDIVRSDIARLHTSMKSSPYQANRTLAFLSKFFNWAEKHGYRPDGSNPCRHVDKYKETKRERFLSQDEIARLGDVLQQAEDTNSENPWVLAAIRLLIMTGARLSEIRTLKWEYVDFQNGILRLPDSKTGAKTIHLNPPALQVLQNIPKLKKNPYVICGEKKGACIVNMQKPWRRIRKTADLDDLRIHDLRHSFASVAVAGGMSLHMVGKLLGHSQPATTARYAHFSSDPLKDASERIGGVINQQLMRSNNAKS